MRRSRLVRAIRGAMARGRVRRGDAATWWHISAVAICDATGAFASVGSVVLLQRWAGSRGRDARFSCRVFAARFPSLR